MKRAITIVDNAFYLVLTIAIAGVITVLSEARIGRTTDNCNVSSGQDNSTKGARPEDKNCVCKSVADSSVKKAKAGIITIEQAERVATICWRTVFK